MDFKPRSWLSGLWGRRREPPRVDPDQLDLRDLIYFDLARCESLFSQVAGGLVREVTSGSEHRREERNLRKYDLKLFRPEFGGVSSESTSRLESKVVHHDLLIRLEQYLFDARLATDLNDVLDPSTSSAEPIRDALAGFSSVRAEGWAVFEDYERIKRISERFNSVMEFIGRCGMRELEKSPDYQALMESLDDARKAAEANKDRNQRAKDLEKLKTIERRFQAVIEEQTGLTPVDEWLLEGMGFFIDTFMPNRINLRIYPFEDTPEFQLLSNLKRDCFLDDDLENVVFAYGNRPSVRLTVLGIITAQPSKDESGFDPMAEFASDELSEVASFEKGFRGVFNGMEGFNRFARFSRFPNITIYPLAIYRRLRRQTEHPDKSYKAPGDQRANG